MEFCLACLSRNELLQINKPFKDESDLKFVDLISKTFKIEQESLEYVSCICLKCSHMLLAAYKLFEEITMTIKIITELNDESTQDDSFISFNVPESPEIKTELDLDVKPEVPADVENVEKEPERKRRSYVKQLNLDEEATICPVCNKNLFWPVALRNHIRHEHSRRYKCDICEKTFGWKSCLNRHMLTHNPDWSEDDPRKVVKKKKYPKTNVVRKKYKEPTPYKLESNQTVCNICKAEFTLPRMLRIHMHEHFPLHVCEQCGKGYSTKNSWRRHKASHESGPHTCHHCGKVFNMLNTLQSHLRWRHSNTTLLFPCGTCDERFSTQLKRINHRAEVHNETTKMYPCPHCPRVFKVYIQRSTHIKSRHVSDNNKTCNYCSKQFSEVKNLGRHIRKVHKTSFSYKKHSYFAEDKVSNYAEA